MTRRRTLFHRGTFDPSKVPSEQYGARTACGLTIVWSHRPTDDAGAVNFGSVMFRPEPWASSSPAHRCPRCVKALQLEVAGASATPREPAQGTVAWLKWRLRRGTRLLLVHNANGPQEHLPAEERLRTVTRQTSRDCLMLRPDSVESYLPWPKAADLSVSRQGFSVLGPRGILAQYLWLGEQGIDPVEDSTLPNSWSRS